MATVLRKTTVAGLDVRVRGAGEPVLLVHGSGGGLDSWAAVAAQLAEGFEVWTFARGGYAPGRCPTPSGSCGRGSRTSPSPPLRRWWRA